MSHKPNSIHRKVILNLGMIAISVATLVSQTAVARLSVTPFQLSFPPTEVGRSSVMYSIRIQNMGSETVNGLWVNDFCSSDFWVWNTCMSSLNPNASCEVHLRFTPRLTGIRTCNVNIRAHGEMTEVVNVRGVGMRAHLSDETD